MRALHRQAGAHADLGIGPDAGGDDDHVAFQAGAVLEARAGDPCRRRGYSGRRFLQVDRDAHGFHGRPQHATARPVQLLFHQVVAEMDHVDGAAVVEQTARRFQTQQAAADDRRLCALLGVPAMMPSQSSSVRKTKTPSRSLPSGAVMPSIGGMKGAAAGGDQQLVVMDMDACRRSHRLGGAVDVGDRRSGYAG